MKKIWDRRYSIAADILATQHNRSYIALNGILLPVMQDGGEYTSTVHLRLM